MPDCQQMRCKITPLPSIPLPIRCFSVPLSCPVIVEMRSGKVKWIENQLAECFCLFFSPSYFQKHFCCSGHLWIDLLWVTMVKSDQYKGIIKGLQQQCYSDAVQDSQSQSCSHFILLSRRSISSPPLSLCTFQREVFASLSSFRDKRNVYVHLTHREPVLIK